MMLFKVSRMSFKTFFGNTGKLSEYLIFESTSSYIMIADKEMDFESSTLPAGY